MKIITSFLVRNIFTNFLAIFLVALSIADGEEAEHDIMHPGFHLSEIDYEVDFPTSLTRSSSSVNSNFQREAALPFFTIEFNRGFLNVFSDSKLEKRKQLHLHPLLTNLVEVVICKNAP